MGHVLARVLGFGCTIFPVFPFRFERVEGSARVLCVERGSVTSKVVTVSVEAGGPPLNLSPPRSSVAEVCDTSTGTGARDELGLRRQNTTGATSRA